MGVQYNYKPCILHVLIGYFPVVVLIELVVV